MDTAVDALRLAEVAVSGLAKAYDAPSQMVAVDALRLAEVAVLGLVTA